MFLKVTASVFLLLDKCMVFLTVTHCTESSLQAAESLADPTEYENLFPGLREAFAAEHYLIETCLGGSRPAKDYPLVTVRCVTFEGDKVVVLHADSVPLVVS